MIICEKLCKSYGGGHGRKVVLRDVDMTIARGERLGLLGRNGAGKTTLIKQIGGVEMPDSGRIIRKMTCSWPIGFNGGFQGSLTGYDNARFIARIYGRDYKDIKEFVADFTELGNALSYPVKTYSSGMRARLAFALSLAIEFDCYLIDEVILVGDQNFQRKCQHELFEKRADRAMIIVSHDMNIIRDACNRGIVIHEGRAIHFEDVHEATALYESL